MTDRHLVAAALGDLERLHRVDRPDCPARGHSAGHRVIFIYHAGIYRCPGCDWTAS